MNKFTARLVSVRMEGNPYLPPRIYWLRKWEVRTSLGYLIAVCSSLPEIMRVAKEWAPYV